ncbi:MAG TPA: DUF6167 family protein [Nocardioidaceae bacterium]|nr:DUF6167 family protein [Nocardioidaceae bacterium]
MSRALWFVAGAGAGVYAMAKARRAAEAVPPEGLADRLAGLSVGVRIFGEEVRAGMAEKENDLRERVGLALHERTRTRETPELAPGSATREGND